MNKFNVAISLVALMALVCICAAENPELTSELDDDTEVDDELEGGGFFEKYTNARKKVGGSAKDEWGHDVLDKNKGMKELVGKRISDCKHTTSAQACATCCEGSDKASSFKQMSRFTKAGACTCYDRNNAYATGLAL